MNDTPMLTPQDEQAAPASMGLIGQEIHVGTVVLLKSGGPRMTVSQVTAGPDGLTMLATIWFDEEDAGYGEYEHSGEPRRAFDIDARCVRNMDAEDAFRSRVKIEDVRLEADIHHQELSARLTGIPQHMGASPSG